MFRYHLGGRWRRVNRAGIAAAITAAITLLAVPAGLATHASAATRTFSGISVTADGSGYGLISRAGEVYAFGSVAYHGNPTGFTGNIVGISATANGKGYAAISSSGQVYAYGTVAYHGNPTGFTGNIVGISVTADGQGYGAESSIGQVYAYGTVRYWGNGDPGSSLSDQIAAIGNAEHQNPAHNHEIPAGSNCNYYSYALGSGSRCSNGWRSEAWCADFARWVWGQAGANTAGLTAGAISFTKSAGGWHAGNLSGVQVGDVIGWHFGGSTSDDHVSLVVGINSDGSVNILDGNSSNNNIGARTIAANASVSGYAIPTS